jgi:hypothetical protein
MVYNYSHIFSFPLPHPLSTSKQVERHKLHCTISTNFLFIRGQYGVTKYRSVKVCDNSSV